MSLRPRKRRRSQAFERETHEPLETNDTPATVEDSTEADVDSLTGDLKKDIEIWEAFKEEHFEAIEQLPLSLHRHYILLKELDGQAQAYNTELLTSVRKYIALRKACASRPDPLRPTIGVNESEPLTGQYTDTEFKEVTSQLPFSSAKSPSLVLLVNVTPTTTAQTNHLQRNESHGGACGQPAPVSAQHIPFPDSVTPLIKSADATRSLLMRIAQLSEETLKASEEKVNLAQTAYESVDRHIRLFDQAIKEQEASISLGARAGTHLAPILLPDLVVPKWARPSRIEHSPVPSLSPEDELIQVAEPLIEDVADPEQGLSSGIVPDAPVEAQLTHKKQKKGSKKSAEKKVEGNNLETLRERPVRSLKLKVPAQPPPQPTTEPSGKPPTDLQEERYCYCNQVSFGTMVGCDNPDCVVEWFHLSCLGLKKAPGGMWFCRNCKPNRKGK